MNFKPYRVILQLVSPVVITKFAPNLDGVLYAAISQCYPSKSHDDVLAHMNKVLLFNDDLGVFHSSCLQFGIDDQHGLVASSYNRTDYWPQAKLSSDMFLPHGIKGRYPNIVFAGGPTKKRMTRRPAYAAQFAVFDFVGDAQKVLNLLRMAHVGIGYDAMNVSMGEFNTKTIEINELTSDKSIFDGNKPTRVIPYTADVSGNRDHSPLIPPYFEQHRAVDVLAPERIRIIHTKNF